MFRVCVLFLLLCPATAVAIEYTPLVDLPFVGSGAQTIGGYFVSIFRLLIGIAGILAVGRMVLCGFDAIISVNPSVREEASQCVLGAVTGLLLALSAWMILYQINPTLLNTNFLPPSTGSVGTGGGAQPGGGTPLPPGGGTPAQCDVRNLCQGEAGPACSGSNPQCAQYSGYANEFASASVSADLIREIMAQESSCNINAQSAYACGLMQLRPTTAAQHRAACGIPTAQITCAWLQNPANARLSVCLAAQELAALSRGACGASQRHIIAGYNGGSGACFPSADCTNTLGCDGRSMSRWECPYDNPAQTTCNIGSGSFEETRTYVRRLIRCL